jgi:hypothetical protein
MELIKEKWTASIGERGATINVDNNANHPLTFEMDFPDKYHHPELNAEAKANANLIASAPELLDLARMERDKHIFGESKFIKKYGMKWNEIKKIREKLIAKAEGGV